jgi:hypothetical protein
LKKPFSKDVDKNMAITNLSIQNGEFQKDNDMVFIIIVSYFKLVGSMRSSQIIHSIAILKDEIISDLSFDYYILKDEIIIPDLSFDYYIRDLLLRYSNTVQLRISISIYD